MVNRRDAGTSGRPPARGHDHETDSGAMALAEKRWRAKLGLPNGLIERVRAERVQE